MNNNNIFLIDANAFLTPSKEYYRFSVAPSYWKQINDIAQKGCIKTIDKINKEVCPRDKESDKDDIQLWFENDFKGDVLSTNKQEIVNEYQNIINHLYINEKYSEKAVYRMGWQRRHSRPLIDSDSKSLRLHGYFF
ncbi:DUF4411 family protein [Virgibacillus sp. NKC19-3]|uniref:DUF4411 family protein n=1 Tax=Virgibacillus saliphilus TaxID=2831674 RepID=UPI001C9AFEBF|nr:DUF4411 family protein [Virgibacillus sp. NKC19-3]MBY7144548.1 DUF4411 family protein [Virgibacillus sp. NKC19-3]